MIISSFESSVTTGGAKWLCLHASNGFADSASGSSSIIERPFTFIVAAFICSNDNGILFLLCFNYLSQLKIPQINRTHLHRQWLPLQIRLLLNFDRFQSQQRHQFQEHPQYCEQ